RDARSNRATAAETGERDRVTTGVRYSERRMTNETRQIEAAPELPSGDERADMSHPSGGFSLASLMLVVTLVSIICGLSAIAPGLGIVAVVVSLPAFARTAII